MQETAGARAGRPSGASRSALQTVTTEHLLRLPFGEVSVSRYEWDHPTDDTWTLDSHFIDFSLTPRPRPAWASFVSERRHAAVQLGAIMFVPAGQTVRSGAAIGHQRSLGIRLAASALDGMIGRSPVWDVKALAEGLHLDGAGIERLLLDIYQELRQPRFASPIMIELLTQALSVALIRRFGLDNPPPRAVRAGGLAPWRMRRIGDRIHAEAPPPCLQELADLCGMSVRHLTRAFRIETGETIADHVRRVTIQRAAILLADPAMPIAEIARTLGFASSTSFSYAFRRATGQCPSGYGRRATHHPRHAAPRALPA